MKLWLSRLIGITLCSSSLCALETNRTFHGFRPLYFSAPLKTTMWSHQTSHKPLKSHHSALRIAPFTELSSNKGDLGKYFSFNNRSNLIVGSSGNYEVHSRHLKFDETSSSNLKGTLKLAPWVSGFGFFFSYHQTLVPFSNKIFFEITAPFVYLATHANPDMKNETASSSDNKHILDYFAGKTMLERTNSSGLTPFSQILQRPLESAKIPTYSIHRTNVADLHVSLGCYLLRSQSHNLNIRGTLSFPTTASARGEWLFEPVIGSGGHAGTSVTIESDHKFNERLRVVHHSTYAYVFRAHEIRTLGLKNQSGTPLNWGQYLLVAEIGSPLVIPAANVLTQQVKVSPGSQFDGLLGLRWQQSRLTFECGYNLYVKEGEKVRRDATWDDTRYAFPGTDYLSTLLNFDAFTLDKSNLNNTIDSVNAAGSSASERGTILSRQLDASVAATPHSWLNTFYAALSYEWRKKHHTVTVGGGSSIQVPDRTENVDFVKTTFWGFIGIVF